MPSHELFQEAEAGKVKLGGCCIIEGGPEYFCKDCENEWNKEQAIDAAYGKIKKPSKHRWEDTSVAIIM